MEAVKLAKRYKEKFFRVLKIRFVYTSDQQSLIPIRVSFLFDKTMTLVFCIVNKQINDKERVAAAMENPNLKKIVDDCLKEPE